MISGRSTPHPRRASRSSAPISTFITWTARSSSLGSLATMMTPRIAAFCCGSRLIARPICPAGGRDMGTRTAVFAFPGTARFSTADASPPFLCLPIRSAPSESGNGCPSAGQPPISCYGTRPSCSTLTHGGRGGGPPSPASRLRGRRSISISTAARWSTRSSRAARRIRRLAFSCTLRRSARATCRESGGGMASTISISNSSCAEGISTASASLAFRSPTIPSRPYGRGSTSAG